MLPKGYGSNEEGDTFVVVLTDGEVRQAIWHGGAAARRRGGGGAHALLATSEVVAAER